MTRDARSLVSTAALACAILLIIDRLFGVYAERHFLPARTLHDAESKRGRCVVTLGDSRMAAGVEPIVLEHALREGGHSTCVAQLAIGAMPISGQAQALRKFTDDGGSAELIVLGASAGTLLMDESSPPDAMVGNRAAELAWSRANDVWLYYPNFPAEHFDSGLRFSLLRMSSIGTYESLVWLKVQNAQASISSATKDGSRNRFGTVSDMNGLLAVFRDEANRRLDRPHGSWRLSPWFELIRGIARRSGASLLVLEMPMRSDYLKDVIRQPAGLEYRQWLIDQLGDGKDQFADLSDMFALDDAAFEDGLHLGPSGASRFSTDLAREVIASAHSGPN